MKQEKSENKDVFIPIADPTLGGQIDWKEMLLPGIKDLRLK